MSAVPAEKLGVVVIHGVGENFEGWTDSYLVPELEKWLAYHNVSALERKDQSNDLVFVVRASDGVSIALGLGNDSDFLNFCHVAGFDVFAENSQYQTRAQRLSNRDLLKDYIAPVIALQPAGTWLEMLHGASVPAAIAFDPQSVVSRVRDPESSDPTRTWQSFTRYWPIPGRQVILTELFWADMSKVGSTNFSRFSAILQLFLESHYVLGNAFLKGCERGLYGAIRWLIQASSWTMRWLISGLSAAVLITAFAVVALQQLGISGLLIETIFAGLTGVAVGGYLLFRKWVHRKVGLADLALSASICAVPLLGALGLAAILMPAEKLAAPEGFLIAGIAINLFAWVLWTITTGLAIVLVGAVAVKQFFIGREPGTPPAARPAAALSLNLILGMIWKFVLTLLGGLVISILAPGSATIGASCPAGAQLDAVASLSAACQLAHVKSALIQFLALNLISIITVAVAAAIVLGVRAAGLRIYSERAKAGELKLPRVIASPLVIFALFASAIINAVLYLGVYKEQTMAPLGVWLVEYGESIFSSAAFFLIIFLLIQWIVDRSSGVVHIGRDLVDHQYDPDPRSLVMRLSPDRLAGQDEGGATRKRFRRRQRIQRRLEALIDEVIVGQQVDRLIFLAHSQGTVIMHDYLMNHDALVEKSQHNASASLSGVKRIDILTIGSPLKHIYRHYFQDYDRSESIDEAEAPLIDRVASWTNLWRVDDPIGRDVDLNEGIVNIGLGPGGHTAYWNDSQVCEKLWSLIAAPAD